MYNNNTPLIERTIQIADITIKDAQIKIKDEFGNLYSFFKTKKDGTKTKAMLTAGGIKKGMTVTMLFKEVPYKESSLNSIMKFNREQDVQAAPVQVPQPKSAEAYEISVEDIPF